MGLNDVVSSERLHIGFFGMRNAGKSSLVNAVTGQDLCVVSDIKGTTTDPVSKSMELLPLGPVVIIDTPGLDDEGELGDLRVKKAMRALAKTDIAVLVVDATVGKSQADTELENELKSRKIPYIIAYNKCDIADALSKTEDNAICISAKNGVGVNELKEMLGQFSKKTTIPRYIISDLLNEGDVVILVTPIDESAPKGRIILPQQMTLREILDSHATAIVCQPEQLEGLLSIYSNSIKMVVTDSQVFGKVSKITPVNIPLTSFSILMARYKGDLEELVRGFAALSNLEDGDNVLICEGCTHHRQCNDIGTVKMPGWIKDFSGVEPRFSFTSGGEFPSDLSTYKVIVHCGGCMLNEAEMKHRINQAKQAGIPIVNYGIAIAGIHGILPRSLELFPDMLSILK